MTASWDENGIMYHAGEASRSMTSSMTSEYLRKLETRCDWVAAKFGNADSAELTGQFADSGHLWGAELETVATGMEVSWQLS